MIALCGLRFDFYILHECAPEQRRCYPPDQNAPYQYSTLSPHILYTHRLYTAPTSMRRSPSPLLSMPYARARTPSSYDRGLPHPSLLETTSTLIGASTTDLAPPSGSLNLLRTPTLVRLSHIGWRFDGGNELENDVGDTHNADDGTRNVVEPFLSQQNRSNQNVNCESTSVTWRHTPKSGNPWCDLQTPRPRKLKKKEAYRMTYGGV